MRKRMMRIRYTAGFKCLACYMLCFALPLLWQYAGLVLAYPYRLAFTAPDIASSLAPYVTLPAAPVYATYREAMAAQERLWLVFVALSFSACWLLSLLTQLLWRITHRSPIRISRSVQRAVTAYRLLMLFVWALCLTAAAAVWHFGVQHIAGRTVWDYLVYFGGYPLIALAVCLTSRLAAPAVLSGKHGFFKRL